MSLLIASIIGSDNMVLNILCPLFCSFEKLELLDFKFPPCNVVKWDDFVLKYDLDTQEMQREDARFECLLAQTQFRCCKLRHYEKVALTREATLNRHVYP